MDIRKFKNGKIKMELDSIDKELKNEVLLSDDFKNYDDVSKLEYLYHDEMFFSDLSLNQINGYMYMVDFNSQLVYEYIETNNGTYCLSSCQNPLKSILDDFMTNDKIYLLPLTKKESQSLIEDLENGY